MLLPDPTRERADLPHVIAHRGFSLKKPARHRGMDRELARLLANHPMRSRVTVQSFDSDSLHTLARHAPQIRLALLVKAPPHRPALHAWASSVNPWHGGLSSAYVRRAQLAGLTTYAWTVNEANDIRRLADMGVDAIITDLPSHVVRSLSGAGASR